MEHTSVTKTLAIQLQKLGKRNEGLSFLLLTLENNCYLISTMILKFLNSLSRIARSLLGCVDCFVVAGLMKNNTNLVKHNFKTT